MLIAKTTEKNGKANFGHVIRVGKVHFDPRDGWVLLAAPLDARPLKRELRWIHPNDVRVEWVREFRFAETTCASAAHA